MGSGPPPLALPPPLYKINHILLFPHLLVTLSFEFFFGWTEKTIITKRLSQLCVELQRVLKQENRPKQPTITVPKKEVLLILPYLDLQ